MVLPSNIDSTPDPTELALRVGSGQLASKEPETEPPLVQPRESDATSASNENEITSAGELPTVEADTAVSRGAAPAWTASGLMWYL